MSEERFSRAMYERIKMSCNFVRMQIYEGVDSKLAVKNAFFTYFPNFHEDKKVNYLKCLEELTSFAESYNPAEDYLGSLYSSYEWGDVFCGDFEKLEGLTLISKKDLGQSRNLFLDELSLEDLYLSKQI